MIRAFVTASAIALTAPALAPAAALAQDLYVSTWNPAVQFTAERSDRKITADIASTGWASAEWVSEPAPAYGPGAVFLRNAWRNSYLTYIHEMRAGEFTSNAVLLPKIANPATPQDRVRADGQAWIFEPVSQPGFTNTGRLRPAHKGFGLTWLSIASPPNGPLKPGEAPGFHDPAVDSFSPNHPGTIWMRTKASRVDQRQCVKNMSGTVMDVDWFKAGDMTVQIVGRNVLGFAPPAKKIPDFSERKSLFFESCENSSQRMVAVIKLVGKDTVTSVLAPMVVYTATSAGIIFGLGAGGVAGAVGGTKLAMYLNEQPSTAYIGVPGKVELKGTLYDPTVTTTEPLRY
jgi:hypothetical protein